MYSELKIYKANKEELIALSQKYLGKTWQSRITKEQDISHAGMHTWRTSKRRGQKAEKAVRQALLDFREMVLEPSED
jgi:hypothetical protein